MAESVNVIRAVVQQWTSSTAVLQTIPIRSTRIPAGPSVNFPYCLVTAKVAERYFNSGTSRVTNYLVTLKVYIGQQKATMTHVSDAMMSLFNENLGLPVLDNCYVLRALPVEEDPTLDKDDFYGADCSYVLQQFKVTLNEFQVVPNITLAT